MTRLRILYLHPAAAYGGASKSLIELFGLLREKGVEGTVLTPSGTAATAFIEAGMSVIPVRGMSQLDNTRYGHYRHLRWLILIREIFFLPFALHALWRLRRLSFDIIHVNEITLLPLGIVAKKWLKLPMVVHVRSLQCLPGSSWRTQLINYWLRRYADSVVAIDHTVAGTLGADLPLIIVHNGLRVDVQPVDISAVRDPATPIRVGFMGVLIALKGIYELVEAMRILKERGVAIECVIAGENARELSGFRAWLLQRLGFARDVRSDIEVLIKQNKLEHHVRLLGFVKDVRGLYPTIDILCFPSHLNAAGRPVFEAAFYGIPSVVAIAQPLPDAVVHEVTGLAISAPDPLLIANALQRLADDDEHRRGLGRQARSWASENFSIDTSASLMQGVYIGLLKIHHGHSSAIS